MIRSATEHDRSAIFEMAAKLATSSVITKDTFDASFSEIMKLPHMCLLVAEEAGGLLGYVLGSYSPCFYASSNVSWTAELFVESGRRKEGVGRLLMEGVENWARNKNCTWSTLATRRAAPFYRALAYDETAGYYKKSI
ncbi:MAG: GNAT family N-acetyltransferase [Luteolibacter sp.]